MKEFRANPSSPEFWDFIAIRLIDMNDGSIDQPSKVADSISVQHIKAITLVQKRISERAFFNMSKILEI